MNREPLLPYTLEIGDDGALNIVQNFERYKKNRSTQLWNFYIGLAITIWAFWMRDAVLITINLILNCLLWPPMWLSLKAEGVNVKQGSDLLLENNALSFYLPSGKKITLGRDQINRLTIYPSKDGQTLVPCLRQGWLADMTDSVVDRLLFKYSKVLVKHEIGITLNLSTNNFITFVRKLNEVFPDQVDLLEKSPDGKYSYKMPVQTPPPLPASVA